MRDLLKTPLRCFVALTALELLLAAPGFLWPSYLDTPIGLILLVPFLSAYVFSMLGVPGLIENAGACGWGMCPPSLLGWGVIIACWALITWGLAKLCFFMLHGAPGKPD